MSNPVFQIPANFTWEGTVRRHLGTIRQLWLVGSENRVELVWLPMVLRNATVFPLHEELCGYFFEVLPSLAVVRQCRAEWDKVSVQSVW